MATPNMDWMYKRPTVDTEQYLLGKPIDKSAALIDNPDGVPTSAEDIGGQPGALFLEAAASAALEAEAKNREDPLYAIKKKEEEQRRALLNNPVRLKMMQDENQERLTSKSGMQWLMVNIRQEQLEKKRKQEEKKNSKRSTEKDILAKMMKLKSRYGSDLKDLLKDDSRRRSDHDRRRGSGSRNRSPLSSSRQKSGSSASSYSQSKSSRHDGSSRQRSRSPSTEGRREPDRSRSSKNRDAPRRQSQSPVRSLPAKSARSSSYRKPAQPFQQMTPEELERKRKEMIADAKVRDDERATNVSAYKRRDAADEERDKVVAGRSSGFIRPMLSKATESGTLESRLNMNKNKLQRTSAALDKNFTKR